MHRAKESLAVNRSWLLTAGITVAVVLLLLPCPEGMSEAARRAGVIGAFMAFLWVSELVPLAAAALIPLAAFPLAGVMSLEKTAQSYAHPLIFLFMGGFMLAAAMQRWQLHKRLALGAVALSGRRPRAIVMAMMATTAFLSLWVSNTATAMVMVPIAISLVGDEPEEGDPFAAALMLGIAFAATIGGMGSLIGTPPNALLAGFMQKTYGIEIGFAQWLMIGIPIVAILIPITWLLLTRLVFQVPDTELPDSAFPAPPAGMSRGEYLIALVLAATAAAWILRPWISDLFGLTALSDAGIAIVAVLVLFLLPERLSGTRALLDWEDVKSIRWDVLILFGGGLALADALSSTGLAEWFGGRIGALHGIPVVVLILIMMLVIVYLGELASNTAMAAVFLPVAGAAAVGLGLKPLELALPVALAASLGFMLPVATPPNAIVYGTGAITSRQMLKAGAALDVISILIVFAVAVVLAPVVFPG